MHDDKKPEETQQSAHNQIQVSDSGRQAKTLRRPLSWFAWQLDNPHRVLFVFIIGLLCFALLTTSIGWKKSFLISWIISISSYLLLVAIVAIDADAIATKKRVRHEPQALTILVSIVMATLLSNISFAIILNLIKSTGIGRDHVLITLCGLAIMLSWMLLHTGFGRYYCQVFYATKDHLGQPAEGGIRGGFTFHKTPEPSQLDFFYLAFMIGLTYCCSDVNINNRHARKLVLLHSLVSFIFYSTIITSLFNVAIFSS